VAFGVRVLVAQIWAGINGYGSPRPSTARSAGSSPAASPPTLAQTGGLDMPVEGLVDGLRAGRGGRGRCGAGGKDGADAVVHSCRKDRGDSLESLLFEVAGTDCINSQTAEQPAAPE